MTTINNKQEYEKYQVLNLCSLKLPMIFIHFPL